MNFTKNTLFQKYIILKCMFVFILLNNSSELSGKTHISPSYQIIDDTIPKKKRTFPEVFIGGGVNIYVLGLAQNPTLVGVNFGVYVYKNWYISYSFRDGNENCPNLPNDYVPEVGLISRGNIPTNIIKTDNFMMGRRIKTSYKFLTFNVEIGLGRLRYDEKFFYSNPAYGRGGFILSLGSSSNYNVETVTRKAYGLSSRLMMNFPFAEFYEVGIAFFTNINPIKNIMGVEVYFNLGNFYKRK